MAPVYGPYSPVRQVGNLLFISGQVGINPDTKLAPSDIAGQTEQVLNNLKDVLESCGAGIDNIVKTTIYLVNMDHFEAMNSVYEGFFKAPRPARSTVAVSELPRVGGNNKLLVEIEAVAQVETK